MRISPLFGRRLSVCEQCRWFKAVLLESGRTRRLCVLTGEKIALLFRGLRLVRGGRG